MVNIVGIDNKADLLQKMYDQFIVSRQYLLAWIGFKQEDCQISCLLPGLGEVQTICPQLESLGMTLGSVRDRSASPSRQANQA